MESGVWSVEFGVWRVELRIKSLRDLFDSYPISVETTYTVAFNQKESGT